MYISVILISCILLLYLYVVKWQNKWMNERENNLSGRDDQQTIIGSLTGDGLLTIIYFYVHGRHDNALCHKIKVITRFKILSICYLSSTH